MIPGVCGLLPSCAAERCPAWDADGDGPCNVILGAAWDGERCVYLSGCSCVGRDCDLLRGANDRLCLTSACNPRPAHDAGPSE